MSDQIKSIPTSNGTPMTPELLVVLQVAEQEKERRDAAEARRDIAYNQWRW